MLGAVDARREPVEEGPRPARGSVGVAVGGSALLGVSPSRYSRVAVTALLNGVAGLVLVPFGCSLAAIIFGHVGAAGASRASPS